MLLIQDILVTVEILNIDEIWLLRHTICLRSVSISIGCDISLHIS